MTYNVFFVLVYIKSETDYFIRTGSNMKVQDSDVDKLAEYILILDSKADLLDNQAKQTNIAIAGIPATERKTVQSIGKHS